jgi:hypothetical protein
MNRYIRLTLVIFASVAAQCCADHPTTVGPVNPAMPATADATSPASPVVPVSAKTQQLVLVDKTLTQVEVNRLLSQGYKPQQGRGDNVLYCRNEAQLGSHFEKRVCLTADQIKTATQDSRDATESLQHNLGNPAKPCPTCS